MGKIIKSLKDEGIKTPVMVGGAVITPDYAKEIGGDYAKDAMDAVRKIERILK